MQLDVRAGLMAAACTLLAPAVKAQSEPPKNTQLDTGLLYYQEDQGRIQSIDAIVKLSHDFGEERLLAATVAVDTLSGGSPNGAVPQKVAQTFTQPSGNNRYTVPPGRQPLDPNFSDERVAGDLDWSQPLGIGNTIAANGHLSIEHDFQSAAGSALFSHDFNRKNSTIGAGFSAELDAVKPIGGAPVAGSDYSLQQKGGSRSKNVLGAQLGLTQVLTRTWVAQLNFSADRSNGYLNDPYKLVSRLAATGVATGYVFESRPDSRMRRSLWLGNKVALGSSVLELSYRYGSDDWGIRSHTLEAHYRIRLREWLYVEPQVRWYRQTAADFYRLYLDAAQPLPDHMSADPRLAAFTARTFGLKLGVPLSGGDELSIRLEVYQQDPKVRSSPLPGLTGLDLNPPLRALVLQLDWHTGLDWFR